MSNVQVTSSEPLEQWQRYVITGIHMGGIYYLYLYGICIPENPRIGRCRVKRPNQVAQIAAQIEIDNGLQVTAAT